MVYLSLRKGTQMSEKEKISLSGPPGAQVEPGESGYVPPSETVPLPSKGAVYGLDSPLANKDLVEIRSMTARDEDILTSRALIKQGKVISALLKSCIVDKRVDPDKLLTGDRNALLVAIRITGYGAQYEADATCPECGEVSKVEFDLAQLPIKPLSEAPVRPNENLFSFHLPVLKKEVIFKLLTGEDERDMSVAAERSKKAGVTQDAAVTTRMLYLIQSIGSEKDRNKLVKLIKDMPARDSKALRQHIDKISPGIEMNQVITCRSCGEAREVDVPVGTEFFWPSGG